MPPRPTRTVCCVLLAVTALTACSLSTRPAQPAVMASTELTVPAEQIRVRTIEEAAAVAALVELAADDVLAQATEPAIRRNALLWKANLIPAIQTSVVQFDPLVSYLDLFALCIQADDFVRTGAGRTAFGPYQDRIQRATTQGVARMRALGLAIVPDSARVRRGETIASDWARAHPVASVAFARQTMATEGARFLAADDRSAFAAVGRLEGNVTDLNTRAALLMAHLPKQIRWEAQLLSEELLGQATLDSALAGFSELARAMGRVSAVAESLPGLVAWGPVLEAVAAERATLLHAVTEERIASFAAVAEQLERLVDAITAERVATLTDAEAMVDRAVQRSEVTLNRTIDHLVWRLGQLLAGTVVVAAVALGGVLIALRRRPPPVALS